MKSKILFLGLVFLFFLVTINLLSKSVPKITEDEKLLAIASIKEQSGVKDAAIKQKDEKVSLAMIVEYGTSKERAKELGENFVRLVKTFSQDVNPEKEIGRGIYDYLIGVYYPNNKEIVMGAKASIARSITW